MCQSQPDGFCDILASFDMDIAPPNIVIGVFSDLLCIPNTDPPGLPRGASTLDKMPRIVLSAADEPVKRPDRA